MRVTPQNTDVNFINLCFPVVASIEQTCEDGGKMGELRGDIDGVVRYVLTASSREPRFSPPKEQTVQSQDALEDTACKPGV
jgi:hypothetical protein